MKHRREIMLSPTDERFARERHCTLLHEAERQQMIRQALRARQRPHPPYGPALAWLGWRLSDWGQQLLMRYSQPDSARTHALPN